MKKVLITGASGFIGKNLAEQLKNDYELHTPTSKQLDLTEQKAVESYLKREQFDIVLHCAALLNKRNVPQNPGLILEKNLQMYFQFERCCDYFGKMFYFGSGAAYGRDTCPPMVKESDLGKTIPAEPYGFSKYVMAKSALASHNIYDLTLFGVYGKYEDWRIRFISNACCRVLFDLPICMNQNLFFDYLYINDLVKLLRWFMENKPKYKRYHLCTGRKTDLYTLAQMVLAYSGKDLEIQVEQEGLGHEYTGDCQRMLGEIGDFCFTELSQGIGQLYEYYRENRIALDIDNMARSE